MQNTTQTTGKTTPGTDSTSDYLALINTFPPRPITSEEGLIATQKIIDSLLERRNLTQDERDYIHMLNLLVYEYEKTHYPLPDIHGVELLKVMMEELNIRQKDLVPIFKTESIVSAVLSGQRKLTVTHIQKLADFFHVSPAVFFEQK
jgi:HTH-type transcriptional regulator/antitoxin HigA